VKKTLIAVMLLAVSISAVPFASADEAPVDPKKQAELMDKIEELQKQIEDLKVMKQKKLSLGMKRDQCMKAVGVESYCNCVVDKLPATVDYKQFVHIVLGTAAELGYDKMSADQKKDIDSSLIIWAKCVDYKGPKGSGAGGFFDNIMNRDTLF